MKPLHTSSPAILAAARAQKRGIVPLHVDRRYREGLTECCRRGGGQKANYYLRQALDNGPSPGGVEESLKYFGEELHGKLIMTAPVVEAIEITMPGFGRWLATTGFGNDKTMLKCFIAWAEYVDGAGKVEGEVMEMVDKAKANRA